MGIYNDIKQVKRLTNGSLGAIIENSNNNFIKLSSAFKTFLDQINYNETDNDVTFHGITSQLISLTDSLTMNQNGIRTLLIDSQGRITGKSILVEVSQSKRHRFTEFPDRPDAGVLGEVVYTGPNSPTLEEGLWLYTEYAGWVRLDGGEGGGGCCNLEDLPDVNISESPGPQNDDVLSYDADSGKWVNRQLETHQNLVTDVTFNELETMIHEERLEPFYYYRITDFYTTGYIIGTTDTFSGPVEPIVVQALSRNSISERVWSDQYPNDEIRYSMDTSFTTIVGYKDSAFWGPGPTYSLVPNYRGRITYRREIQREISGPYDWRNWVFRLYKVDAPAWTLPMGASLPECGIVSHNGYIWMTLRAAPGPVAPGANYPWVRIMKDIYCLYDSINLKDLGINQLTVTLPKLSSSYRDQPFIYIENDPSNISIIKNVKVDTINPEILGLLGIGSGQFVTSVPIITIHNENPIVVQSLELSGILNVSASIAFEVKVKNCMSGVLHADSNILNLDLGNLFLGVIINAVEINSVKASGQFDNMIISAMNATSTVKNLRVTGESSGNIMVFIQSSGEITSAGESNGMTLYDCENMNIGRDCYKLFVRGGQYMEIGHRVYNTLISSPTGNSPKYIRIENDLNNLNLTSSSYWSTLNSAAHKTIFKNESGAIRMTYYDSTDMLTIVDPTL